MPSLFRRKPADEDRAAASTDDDSSASASTEPVNRAGRGVTAPKGRPTPKRTSTRRPAEPPPANAREAARRLRERDRAERAAGMASGDDRYLLKRDRGPDRALVRDVVDTRRNTSTLFLPVALITTLLICLPPITGTLPGFLADPRGPGALLINGVFYLMVLVLLVDGYILSRRIRRLMAERLPNVRPTFGHYIYGSQRAIVPRRFRQPKPRLGPDDTP